MGITRELDKEFLLYFYTIYRKFSWSMLMINNLILMSMCSLYINLMFSIRTPCHIYALMLSFWSLLSKSRPMTSHHVTCYVTVVTCLFTVKMKKKKKRNIKSRKIDKRKRKMTASKHTITSKTLELINE